MKYTIPGISLLISFILWIGERWISQVFGLKIEKIIAQVPWGWILICSLAVLFGFVYADFFNESSQLREWIKERNGKLFTKEIHEKYYPDPEAYKVYMTSYSNFIPIRSFQKLLIETQ